MRSMCCVVGVTAARWAIRSPASHRMPWESATTRASIFSVRERWRLVRYWLTVWLPCIPKGRNRSPGNGARHSKGRLRLSASRQAMWLSRGIASSAWRGRRCRCRRWPPLSKTVPPFSGSRRGAVVAGGVGVSCSASAVRVRSQPSVWSSAPVRICNASSSCAAVKP